MTEIQSLYSDAQTIRSLKCSIDVKVRMLSVLMYTVKDAWLVVGITEAALDTFAKHVFKRVSAMVIKRSHIVDRHSTYKEMLTKNMARDEWWDFYRERDKCILATSSENMRGEFVKVLPIDPALGLFKNSGYAWRHGKAEIDFLKKFPTSNITKADFNE